MRPNKNAPDRGAEGIQVSQAGGHNDVAILAAHQDAHRDHLEPSGVMLARLAIASAPLPTAPCRWCGAPAGVRCTVREARLRLRLTKRSTRCHPSREVAA